MTTVNSRNARRGRAAQGGLVLISSMLLLLIITILAVSMFRSFGIQEKIAGNVREKQRATHAAEEAQQYAEWWLASGSNAATSPVACSGVLSANLSEMQICNNVLPVSVDAGSVAVVPWTVSGAPVGTDYVPPSMNVGDTTQPDEYAQAPRFYISYLGTCADHNGTCYQIDAVGYGGGTGTAVSVVESTYEVSSGVTNLGGP